MHRCLRAAALCRLLLLVAGPGLPAGVAAQATTPEALQFSTGGFLKLHALRGDIGAGRDLRADQELFIPQLPVTARPAADARRSHMHARASRLWLRLLAADTAAGQLELFAEADWFKSYTHYRPRLRHGYLRAGRLLVGQTWSTFINPLALADIDAGTAVGNSVTRLHQLRWSQPLRDDLLLHLALEEPVNRLHYSGESGIDVSERERPFDVALQLEQHRERGSLSLSGVWRELGVTSDRRMPTDRLPVAALGLAGRLELGALDNLRFMVNYGNGLARHSTLGAFADAVVDESGALDANTGFDTMLAWQHYWSRQWRSTFALSSAHSALPATAAPTLTRAARSGHANLIWAPNQRWSLGVEFLYGWRKLQNGAEGELQRLQLTFRLNL